MLKPLWLPLLALALMAVGLSEDRRRHPQLLIDRPAAAAIPADYQRCITIRNGPLRKVSPGKFPLPGDPSPGVT